MRDIILRAFYIVYSIAIVAIACRFVFWILEKLKIVNLSSPAIVNFFRGLFARLKMKH